MFATRKTNQVVGLVLTAFGVLAPSDGHCQTLSSYDLSREKLFRFESRFTPAKPTPTAEHDSNKKEAPQVTDWWSSDAEEQWFFVQKLLRASQRLAEKNAAAERLSDMEFQARIYEIEISQQIDQQQLEAVAARTKARLDIGNAATKANLDRVEAESQSFFQAHGPQFAHAFKEKRAAQKKKNDMLAMVALTAITMGATAPAAGGAAGTSVAGAAGSKAAVSGTLAAGTTKAVAPAAAAKALPAAAASKSLTAATATKASGALPATGAMPANAKKIADFLAAQPTSTPVKAGVLPPGAPAGPERFAKFLASQPLPPTATSALTGLPVNASQLPVMQPLCLPHQTAGWTSFFDPWVGRRYGYCCGATFDCSHLPSVCGTYMTPMNRACFFHDMNLGTHSFSDFANPSVINAHRSLANEATSPVFRSLFGGFANYGEYLNSLNGQPWQFYSPLGW